MKVLIADDEPLARKRLARLLSELEQPPTQIIEACDGQEAVTLCAQHQPDIAFLDIRMPAMDGLQAASEINKAAASVLIIFVTAFDEHAIAAFNRDAIDYLLKPIRQQRLQQAFTKAQHYIDNSLNVPTKARSQLCSHSQGSSTLISVAEIICFKADQKYVSAFTEHKNYLLDEPLKALEQEFSPQFLRVHRNALINTAHIHRLKKDPQGEHQLSLQHLDEKITVSRRHLAEVRKILQSI